MVTASCAFNCRAPCGKPLCRRHAVRLSACPPSRSNASPRAARSIVQSQPPCGTPPLSPRCAPERSPAPSEVTHHHEQPSCSEPCCCCAVRLSARQRRPMRRTRLKPPYTRASVNEPPLCLRSALDRPPAPSRATLHHEQPSCGEPRCGRAVRLGTCQPRPTRRTQVNLSYKRASVVVALCACVDANAVGRRRVIARCAFTCSFLRRVSAAVALCSLAPASSVQSNAPPRHAQSMASACGKSRCRRLTVRSGARQCCAATPT